MLCLFTQIDETYETNEIKIGARRNNRTQNSLLNENDNVWLALRIISAEYEKAKHQYQFFLKFVQCKTCTIYLKDMEMRKGKISVLNSNNFRNLCGWLTYRHSN